MKKKKKILLSIIIPIGLILAIVIGYLCYFVFSYHREGDIPSLDVVNPITDVAETGTPYTLLSYNIGFCAYTPDFGFFMDGGDKARANSEESVNEVLEGIASLAKGTSPYLLGLSPDFINLQEVDRKSHRGRFVNQDAFFDSALEGYTSVYAINWDTPYLAYPFVGAHGKALTGIKTMSRFGISNSSRVELPVEDSFMKLVDLDRCYTVSRIPLENGKDLVLYNFHLSAYTSDGVIAVEQLTMLVADMVAEYEAGNYVVGSGDFNKDLLGDSGSIFGVSGEDYTWAQPIDPSLISDWESKGISVVAPFDSDNPVASCRNADGPYNPNQFRVTVDGFLVSDNVTVISSSVIDTGYAYSDHNPVVLTFELNP